MTDHLSCEVVGFRQWRITGDLELRAEHKSSQKWAKGENRAVCVPDSKPSDDPFIYVTPEPCEHAPSSDCNCGLYALHDPSDFWYGKGGNRGGLWGMYSHAIIGSGDKPDPLVSGVIAAWGNIEVHHQGFRSQYARIVALALPESKRDQAIVRACAAEYGVPVVEAERLTQIAGEYGSPIPVEMRPDRPKYDPLAFLPKRKGGHA